ncbi:MAG: hypothetical protein M5R40_02000 [Anaerolineae bacterium]|nr:hypothetical protein [Anaerolineae bacterium]
MALAVLTGALVLLALAARRLPARVRWALPPLPAIAGVVTIALALPEAMRLINEMYAAGYGAGGPLALAGFALAVVGAVAGRFSPPRWPAARG